jgi:LysM repeat protein
MFNFGKDANEPKPADASAVKTSEAQPPASGQDAKPRPGADSKNDSSAPGAAATTPPPQPGSGKGTESGESTRTHKVELGDSYSLLAETYYGSQRYAKFLMDANPQYSDPTKLREGVVLKVPARPNDGPGMVTVKKTSAGPDAAPSTDGASTASAAKAAASKDANDRLYVVQEDDTLYAIASR